MSIRIFKDTSGSFALQIDEHLVDEIRRLCRKNVRKETGGILIGKYSQNLDCAIVKHIEGPPEDSSFGPTWFFRGVKGLKKTLETIWSRERLHYLGEWHYHPFSSPEPSGTDHSYMKSIKENPKVDCSAPVLLILGGDPTEANAPISATVYNKEANPIGLLES